MRKKSASQKNVLMYTCHSKARWCSKCTVVHGHLLHKVGIKVFKSPESCCHSNYRYFIRGCYLKYPDFLRQDRLCGSV